MRQSGHVYTHHVMLTATHHIWGQADIVCEVLAMLFSCGAVDQVSVLTMMCGTAVCLLCLQVDFDIATWDFVLHEEDPTSSEGPVVIKAGTCWGWVSVLGLLGLGLGQEA
jgi:hypothetical protein